VTYTISDSVVPFSCSSNVWSYSRHWIKDGPPLQFIIPCANITILDLNIIIT
jgi:hypothetical protein